MSIAGASSMSDSHAESTTKRDWWNNSENGSPSFFGVISCGRQSDLPDVVVNFTHMGRESLRLFVFGWLFVFPLACGVAVLSFSVMQTMSGRHLGTDFNPLTFTLALLLFSFTGWVTFRYFKKRASRSKRRL